MSLQLLITGTYRSGTGYVSNLLGNHPDLAVGHHTTNWPRERHAYPSHAFKYAWKRWGLVPMHTAWGPLNTPARHWDYVMRRLFGKDKWAEKVQLEWPFIPTFLDWFPGTGRALHIIRDPRAVLASFREYTYHAPPAYLGAAFNCLDAMRHATDSDRQRVVRYEDAATRTLSCLPVITEWLGLDWPGDDVMLDSSQWHLTKGGPVETRSSFQDVRDGFDVDRAVTGWQDTLSATEKLFVETVCAVEMRQFGYEPVTSANMDPDTMLDMCAGDRVSGWCRKWLETGEGTCAFPSDPLDESTWQENVA